MRTRILRNAPSPELLKEYARVPMTLTVTSRLRVDIPGCSEAGPTLIEERVEPAYEKDYDAQADGPVDEWLSRWDISHWVVISAMRGNEYAGGAIAGYEPPVELLEGHGDDLAVLWDIRVRPEFRGTGVG